MMGWYGGIGWGGWLVMTLTMLGFWGLVLWSLVAIFRGGSGMSERSGRSGREAMRILDERFAQGEIDADEYAARSSVLRAQRR